MTGRSVPIALAAAALAAACGAARPPAALQAPATAAQGPFDHAHAAFTEILGRHVRDGVVDYAGLKADSAPLLRYLASLEAVDPAAFAAWTPAERMAFWLNVYNAYMLRFVLDRYPIDSVQSVGLIRGAAFREEFIPLGRLVGAPDDGPISLNTVEHEILRKMGDPRIHMAIVCASRSCPPLREEAFRAADLEAQLDDQARRFLASTERNRIDAASRTLRLSKIFEWFREDFDAAGGLEAFVARYAPGDTSWIRPGVRIEFSEYDWNLNGR